MSRSEASLKYPELVRQMSQLDAEIKGGTMAAVALIMGKKLYVANVGMQKVAVMNYILNLIMLCYYI